VIDSALFLLVLDDFAPENIHVAAANALHGSNQLLDMDTIQVGTCMNRWYDKLQIIVCKDGTSNVNFEHATIDGHTALRLVSDVFAETVISFAESIVNLIHGHGRVPHVINAKVRRVVNCSDEAFDVLPKKILFDVPNATIKRISYAESALCDSVVASDTYVLEFLDYGKKAIVAGGMSPDAFVQMSILLAYYKLYGRVVCMYEPAMTKSFYHGRTEAIRGATMEAKDLCRIWESDDASRSDKLLALKVATVEHSRLTREAASGKGIDRHLFALKCLASRLDLPCPKLFESPGWKAMNHTILSTSNCGNPSLRLFGFGPVVPDGFGIGYIIKDHGISYSVSSKHRQTRRFVGSLRKVLKEMEDLQVNRMSIAVEPPQTNASIPVNNESNPYDRLESYGDVWGESSVTANIADMTIQESTSYKSNRSSKLFNSVSNRSVGSVDLNSLEYIKIDVDLQIDK
jgi:carnitine O-acetyltransferase